MSVTNEKLIKRIEKAKKDKKQLTHITDKSKLSHEDKMKMALCRHFVQFAISKKLKLVEISKMTGIPVTRLSEITNYKITKFTVDKLIHELTKLAEHDPALKEYLLFLTQAAEVPTLKISATRKLARELKEASLAQ